MSALVQTLPPFSLNGVREDQTEDAVLELDGVDMGGAPYEVRVFLNNPKADAATTKEPEAGFASSFYVYAEGAADNAALDSVAPVQRRVPIGDELRRVVKSRAASLHVTLVFVPKGRVPNPTPRVKSALLKLPNGPTIH